jgi:transposase
VDQLSQLLRQHHHPTPLPTAEALWERLHRPQLQADTITSRTKARLMLALVSQLAQLLAQIKQYDAEITRLFLSHPDSPIFASLPRTGKRLVPRLLAGWGDDRERNASAASVQALAGTSPVAYQSGKHVKAHRRYACIKPFRNVLFQFAWQSTFRESWAQAYYHRKRQEGKSHSMAVRALANGWVRIIQAMWLKTAPMWWKPS